MIQKSMKEIQQLFFDLALLVDEQGEMLDYVNINVTYILIITILDWYNQWSYGSYRSGLAINN